MVTVSPTLLLLTICRSQSSDMFFSHDVLPHKPLSVARSVIGNPEQSRVALDDVEAVLGQVSGTIPVPVGNSRAVSVWVPRTLVHRRTTWQTSMLFHRLLLSYNES